MKASDSFGERLRAQRERAGVSLDTIVEVTKIKRSLLVGLENNDLSHWPAGIFRRAFFREYLGVIGIRSEAVVAEFLALFPDPAETVSESTPLGTFEAVASEMRLRFAEPPFIPAQQWRVQAAAAASDLGAVFLLTILATVILPVSVWPAMAVVGLLYYGGSVAWMGLTPGLWWFFGERSSFRLRKKEPRLELPPLRIVARQPEEATAAQAVDVA